MAALSANTNGKPLESWIWDAACSIRGAKDAAKYKEFILPLIFTKRLCNVFDDESNRIAKEVGSRAKAFKLVKHDTAGIRPRDRGSATHFLRPLFGARQRLRLVHRQQFAITH